MPFTPFSQANALYGWISIEALQTLCLACAALVMVYLVVRRLLQIENTG